MMTGNLDVNILICMFSMCLMTLLCIGMAVFFISDGRNKTNNGETHTKTQIVLWYITLVLMFYGAIGYYSLNEFLVSNKSKYCLILLCVILSVISFVAFMAFEISALKRSKMKRQKTQKTDRKKRVAILSVVNLFLLIIIFLLSGLNF